jgi:prevent-host-death family protein
MAKVTVSQLRAHMREALERVGRGEELEVTQHGQVVAVLVHPAKRRPIVRTPSTIAAKKLHEELERLRRNPPPLPSPGISREFAEELIVEIRADRDEDVWDRVEREMAER